MGQETYEKKLLRAGRRHMTGEIKLAVGAGVPFGLPLGKLSTPNHYYLALWLRYLAGPDGKAQVLALFAYLRRYGFMSYMGRDETFSRSHDFLILAFVLLVAAVALQRGDHDVLAEARWWLRGYVQSHILHRVSRKRGMAGLLAKLLRAKDAPHAAMAGARDPGNPWDKVEHDLPVDQTALRDEIVGTLTGELGPPKRNLGIDSLDRSALWALSLPGVLAWAREAMAGLTNADLPPLRYGYRLVRGVDGSLLGRWYGDLADMLRPAPWISYDPVTNRETVGTPPAWGKEDEGHKGAPAPPRLDPAPGAELTVWPIAEQAHTKGDIA